MIRCLFTLVAIVSAASVLPARASQPAPGAAPAIDPDATCLVAVGMATAQLGQDPSFMGANHDRALGTMREAAFFYSGRLTLRHEGAALDRAVIEADNALPRNRFLGVSADCMREYSRAVPGLGDELDRALEAAGISRNGPQPPPTPVDAATLDPDLLCLAVFLQAHQSIDRRNAGAPAGAPTAVPPTLTNGTTFYSARALARLPAATRGARFATTLRSIRDDQRVQTIRQCAGRMSAEMGRIGRAAAAAGAQERPDAPR